MLPADRFQHVRHVSLRLQHVLCERQVVTHQLVVAKHLPQGEQLPAVYRPVDGGGCHTGPGKALECNSGSRIEAQARNYFFSEPVTRFPGEVITKVCEPRIAEQFRVILTGCPRARKGKLSRSRGRLRPEAIVQ